MIMLLEATKRRILDEKEEQSRLNSTVVWINCGDKNTKFFENYTKGRKSYNKKRELPKPNGSIANTFDELDIL